MTNRVGCGAVVIALVGLVALALAQPLVWYWTRMQWLETGAAFPNELGIEETLSKHMEIGFCAEAVYRIDEGVAQNIRRHGVSYLGSLGPNREGDVFSWLPAEALAESGGLQLSPGQGPLCFGGGPPNASRAWPAVSADARGAYVASDSHGTWLLVYPDERLAYFWNQ